MPVPCSKVGVLHWSLSLMSQPEFLLTFFLSHTMKSERTRRSLTWRRRAKGKVFPQKELSVGRRGGEVGGRDGSLPVSAGRSQFVMYLLDVCIR